jgi:hypothetical protein
MLSIFYLVIHIYLFDLIDILKFKNYGREIEIHCYKAWRRRIPHILKNEKLYEIRI